MLAARVIPCHDTAEGRVVKGTKFHSLRDAGDPVARAALYEEQGADELVLLDVSATPEGRGHALETVRAVRCVLAIPLTVGGGVRSVDDARVLLEAGADKVSVNTAAVGSTSRRSTASPWSTRAGGSTSAVPTPSRWCASTSSPAATSG